MELSAFTGELAALGAALIWAIASVVYAQLGQQLSPLVLNWFKGTVAIALILLTLLLRQAWELQVTPPTVGLLVLSGAIGIGLGDTAYFESIRLVGARRGLLLESLAPPIAALIALLFLQEILSPIAWWGIVLTVGGVTWVVLERTPDTTTDPTQAGQTPVRGILLGLVAALSQASGAVLSRAALTGSDITPLWSSLFRIIAGGIVLTLWLLWQQQQSTVVKVCRSPRLLSIIVATAFASTYLAIWLQQIALKFTAAGVAQALGATSPLFVLPLAAMMGDRISLRAVGGVLVALGGIWLLFMR